MLLPATVTSEMKWCEQMYDIDLTLNGKEDHCAAAAETYIVQDSFAPRVEKPFRLNKLNLKLSVCAEKCQQYVWMVSEIPLTVHIDDHLELLNIWVRWAATQTFGPPERQPRKPWLSPQVWQVVQCIAPTRRARYDATLERRRAFGQLSCAAWRYAHALTVAMCLDNVCRTLSWGSCTCYWQGDAIDAAHALRYHFRREAWLAASILNLQKAIRPMLDEDRKKHLDALASSASIALHEDDVRQAFAVVRMLSADRRRRVKTFAALTAP